jgi:hypothetical protein
MNELFSLAAGYAQGRVQRQQMEQEQKNWERQQTLSEELGRRGATVQERGATVQERGADLAQQAQTFQEWAFGQIPAEQREAFRIQELGIERDFEATLRGQDFDKMARDGSLKEMIRQFDETMSKISIPELQMRQDAEGRAKMLFSFDRAIKMAETIGAWVRERYNVATLNDRIELSKLAGLAAKMQLDAERLKLQSLPADLAAELYFKKAQGYATRRQGDMTTEQIITERALRPYRESGMISEQAYQAAMADAAQQNAATGAYSAETERMGVILGGDRNSGGLTNQLVTAFQDVDETAQAFKLLQGSGKASEGELSAAASSVGDARRRLAVLLDKLGVVYDPYTKQVDGVPIDVFRKNLVQGKSEGASRGIGPRPAIVDPDLQSQYRVDREGRLIKRPEPTSMNF